MATNFISTLQTIFSMSDADFRTFILAFHNILTAGGWVQTSDTGQVNTATVTNPGTNTLAGYSVWRSNDATGGLVEIYLRLEFWGNTASRVYIKFQVGFASDGAGNLTGTVSALKNLSTTSSATAGQCILSCGSGYLLILSKLAGASDQFSFSIERLKNNLGQTTNDILIYTWLFSTNMVRSNQVVTPAYAYPAGGTVINMTPTTANSLKNGIVGLGFIFGQKAGLTNPSTNLLADTNRSTAISSLGQAGDLLTVVTFGQAHTYYIFTGDINGNNLMGGGDGGILIRYE